QFDQDSPIRKSNFAFDSFPSGHAATAFSIATVFASEYSDIKVVPVISYSLASLVGITRLTEHKHWASDVFIGSLLGYACGKQVVAHFNKTHQNQADMSRAQSKSGSEVMFVQNGDQVGLAYIW
ncbi:MAG: phosphatase PAP2 family protein, partial [Bacteroidales bacterium]